MIFTVTCHFVFDGVLKSTLPINQIVSKKKLKSMKSLIFIVALCVGYINSAPVHNGTYDFTLNLSVLITKCFYNY